MRVLSLYATTFAVAVFGSVAMAQTAPSYMEDLAPYPTVHRANETVPENPSVSLYDRPKLDVIYKNFLNVTKPNGEEVQLYTVRIRNDGPGHISQLATKIQDWNETTAYWGVYVLSDNQSYVYLPKYRSPLGVGDDWNFGFVQKTNRSTFPTIEPLYGSTTDGRFFNYTSIIPSPENPPGTDANLVATDEDEFYWGGRRYVIFNGRVLNNGTYPLWGVGLVAENFSQATGYWHLKYDPSTNSTYIPLQSGLLKPGEAQDFGFIVPFESGYPNVTLRYVTTPNALWNLTAPNDYTNQSPRDALPRGNGTVKGLDSAPGGISVQYPPVPARVGQRVPRPPVSVSNQTQGGGVGTNTTGFGAEGTSEGGERVNAPTITTSPTAAPATTNQNQNQTSAANATINTTTAAGGGGGGGNQTATPTGQGANNQTAGGAGGGGGGVRRRVLRESYRGL